MTNSLQTTQTIKPEIDEQINDLLLFRDDETHQLLQTNATKHHVHLGALSELLAWARKSETQQRKHNKNSMFNQILSDDEYDWTDLEKDN